MHRKTTLITLVFAAFFGAALAAFSGCTSLLGDYEVSPDNGEAGTNVGPGTNGAACQLGTECGSGFCADGVCCESACSGTCEACNIDKGKCVAVPDGQDPQKECLPEPRPDAGIAQEPDATAPIGDGGDGCDGGTTPEGGVEDDGGAGQIHIPDGGFVSMDEKCAGSCNGNRACKFPKGEVTCGTKFCNTSTQAGRFACDGKGRCELAMETCKSFSCEGEECRVDCTEQNDCQSTHFCNQQGKCQAKLSDGVGCSLPDQCTSGFCVVENGAGVCCNSGCGTAQFGPGATCKRAGAQGQCKCSIDCGTGSCRLYYRDFDGDTYGDKDGTTPNTAVVGCDNAAPPAGFVADNTDCDDKDNRAHPGQTAWYADTTLGKGLNDFNCDGVISKELREYPGATCYTCGSPKECPASTTCPAGSTVQSRLTCALYESIVFCPVGTTCNPYTCGYAFKFATNTTGFTTTVACGATSATYKTCGQCPGSASIVAPPSSVTSAQQRCH
jgi:hypothetical protein